MAFAHHKEEKPMMQKKFFEPNNRGPTQQTNL